jgi:methionine-rich copper-binding protein CopC
MRLSFQRGGIVTIQSSTRRHIIVLCGLLLLLAAVPQAHTALTRSEPAAGKTVTAAPKQVQLWFNEKIDVALSTIELTGPSGKVDLTPAHVMGGKSLMAGVSGKVAEGSYTIAWQTAGDDGHVVKGSVKFTVKLAH